MAESRSNLAKSPPEIDPARRRLLLGGVGGAVAASAVSLAAAENSGPESPAEQTKGRYRLSPHVERFYFLNRL